MNVKQKGLWWIDSGTGARSVGACCGRGSANKEVNSKNQAYNDDLISYDLDLRSSEMFERDYAS